MDQRTLTLCSNLEKAIAHAAIRRGVILPLSGGTPGAVVMAKEIAKGLRAGEMRTVSTYSELATMAEDLAEPAFDRGLAFDAEAVVTLVVRVSQYANARHCAPVVIANECARWLREATGLCLLFDDDLHRPLHVAR